MADSRKRGIWLKWTIAGGYRRIGLVVRLARFLRLKVDLYCGGTGDGR